MKIKALFEIEFPDDLHRQSIESELLHFEETHDNIKLIRWDM